MAREWAIFKIICVIEIVLSIAVSIILLLSILVLYFSGESSATVLDPFPIITLLLFLCMSFFHGICLDLILKKYPNKEINKSYDTIFNTTAVITTLIFILMACVSAYGLIETIQNFRFFNGDYTNYFILFFAFIYLTFHLYCLKQVIKLKKEIKENFIESQQKEIEKLGEVLTNKFT